MIKNFQRKKLALFFFERVSFPKIKHIQKNLLICLNVLHRARSWPELKNFFQADLEELKGDWKDWCSIRVDLKYRIIFQWKKDNNAYEVDLTKHYQKAII